MRALAPAAGLRPPCAGLEHSRALRPSARALAIGLPRSSSRRTTTRRSPLQEQQLLSFATRRIAARSAADGGPAGPSSSSASTSTAVASPPASPDLEQEQQQEAPVATAAPPPPPRVAVPLRLAPAVAYLPHPDKRAYGGEDAHFVTDAGGGCLGVADGVGGWADSGVNPAAYARGLMRAALAHVERGEEGAVEAARAALEAPGGPETAGVVTCRAAARVDFGADGEDVSSVVSEQAAAAAPVAPSSSPAEDEASSSSSSSSSAPLLFSVPAAHYQTAAASDASSSSSSSSGNSAEPPLPDPRAALDNAHRLVRVAGSATAVLLQLDAARSRLSTVNLGDSGFMVLRKSQGAGAAGTAAAGAAAAPSASPAAAAAAASVVHRSSPLQHFFDCPLQLGACPEYVDATDSADQADVRDIPVLPGDVIVAGSDGLWDNVFDEEVAALVSRAFFAVPAAALQPNPAGGDAGVDAQGNVVPPDARLAPALASARQCAEALARTARRHAADERRDSPYAREARLQGLDLPWWEKVAATRFTAGGGVEVGKLTGGKMDDITVLVAQVVAAA